MSSKLVVAADIFNSFENENSSKKEDSREEKTIILDKMESGETKSNCLNGEPPVHEANVSSRTAPDQFSSLSAVEGDGCAELQTKIKTNQPGNRGFVIKSPNGKLIPFMIKNPVFLKNSDTTQKFVIKTASGKQVIIPNVNKKIVQNVSTTSENILINNRLVPVDPGTKFSVNTGSNTEIIHQVEGESVLNIVTTKAIDISKNKVKNNNRKKNKPHEKLYQLQIKNEVNEKINNKLNKTSKNEFLRQGKHSPPLCVESWTQTDVRRRDAACQTDVYVPPTTVAEQPIEDKEEIAELVQYILGTEKYSAGIDVSTKTNIINSTLKLKHSEMAQSQPMPKQPPSLKEQLFIDLRDCVTLDFMGNMPIHNAVVYNELKDLKRQIYILRLRKFSIDIMDKLNQTALQVAITNNSNLDIIETLLISGANITIKDKVGNTLLHLAVLNTNEHVLDLLLRYCNQHPNLLDVKNDEGLTPLMIASIECKTDIVLVLLKYGVNPNLQDDKSGRTALFHAVELNNVPVVTALLRNRADPKIRNFNGLTALEAIKDQNTVMSNMMEGATAAILTTPTASTSTTETGTKRRPAKRQAPEQPRTQAENSVRKNVKMAVISKKCKVQLVNKITENNGASTSEIQCSQINCRKKS